MKQSVSTDHTITNPAQCKPSEEPEYELPIIIDHKPACDAKMNVNPAYHCDDELKANPAHQATS